jgi:hypothetical protein
MTALADLLKPADRERLLERVRELDELADLMRQPGGLAEAPEPVPLHRTRDVTALPVTTPGPQGGLTAPARAVPAVRPPGERRTAPGARAQRRPGEPLLDLSAHAPDRRLGLTQFGDQPRLHGHLLAEGIEVEAVAGQDVVDEPLVGGRPGHVTTIAVTPETLPPHRAGRAEEER